MSIVPNNLPLQVPSFVGRVLLAFAVAAGMLVAVGPAGIGVQAGGGAGTARSHDGAIRHGVGLHGGSAIWIGAP